MLNIEWTNRDALDCTNITCANCQYNDGVVYTSLPPQYKCTITNEFHGNNDKCNVEFAPVKHGRWIEHKDYPGLAYLCSECNYFTTDKSYYCPYCGAKIEKNL